MKRIFRAVLFIMKIYYGKKSRIEKIVFIR